MIWAGLDEPNVAVPGTTAADTVLPRLADGLKTILQQRTRVATEVEEMLDAHLHAGAELITRERTRICSRSLLGSGSLSSSCSDDAW